MFSPRIGVSTGITGVSPQPDRQGPAELLVTFVPGGIEEHFFKYRDQSAAEFDFVGFLTEARDNHGTTYELGG